jgi:hypothetical protein
LNENGKSTRGSFGLKNFDGSQIFIGRFNFEFALKIATNPLSESQISCLKKAIMYILGVNEVILSISGNGQSRQLLLDERRSLFQIEKGSTFGVNDFIISAAVNSIAEETSKIFVNVMNSAIADGSFIDQLNIRAFSSSPIDASAMSVLKLESVDTLIPKTTEGGVKKWMQAIIISTPILIITIIFVVCSVYFSKRLKRNMRGDGEKSDSFPERILLDLESNLENSVINDNNIIISVSADNCAIAQQVSVNESTSLIPSVTRVPEGVQRGSKIVFDVFEPDLEISPLTLDSISQTSASKSDGTSIISEGQLKAIDGK